MELCYMDGQFMPMSEATLPVTDLVIQRGIGVFESIYCYDNKLLAMDLHVKRLIDSAKSMRMKTPHTQEQISDILKEGVRRFGKKYCNARIYLTGGDRQDVGKGFPDGRIFYLFMQGHPLPDETYYETGVSLFLLPQERFCPTVKTINYSAAYIAKEDHPTDLEALYCPDGQITECTSSNIFLVNGRHVVTPPLSRVLAGTTRNMLISLLSEMGFTFEEREVSLNEMWSAEEILIASSTKLVVAVTNVDGKKIGNGKPGKAAIELLKGFRQNLDRFSTQA